MKYPITWAIGFLEIGVKIGFADAEANLPSDADVELVLCDRLEHLTPLVGLRRVRVERYARCGNCDIHLVDLLPRQRK